MRQKTMLVPTLRENPSEAEIISHQLMLRAGLIRQVVSGVYTYLPLGYRVLKRIEQIVREEMDRAGGQEMLMPALHPAELWEETGRFNTYGRELIKLRDRHDRFFVLGPTHEEVVTDLVRREINSYKKLPMVLYQIQAKYRDERRPRFGLLRGREFLMKDAYSFDVDQAGLEQNYALMYEAYNRIFERCQLNFRAVEADAGAIGGTGNHEFMVLSADGEDVIVHCDHCHYAANVEKAEVRMPSEGSDGLTLDMQKIVTPGASTIEQVSELLNVTSNQLIKSIVMQVDERIVLVLVRGDHEVNDTKVKNLYAADQCEMADSDIVRRVTGAPVGFAGPVNLAERDIEIVADYAIQNMVNAVIGANEKDYHYINVLPERDFAITRYADVRMIQADDPCPACGAPVHFSKGMEVGHVFKLNTQYSKKMGATYLDEHGKEAPFIMGCYGIGISRTLAAVVEQNRDDHGIVWPSNVAPFHLHLIAVNMKNKDQAALAAQLYDRLTSSGWEVLFDDRQERAGVKFNDADLIGIPLRLIVGKRAAEGVVECKYRRSGESVDVNASEIVDRLPELYEQVDQS